MADTLLGNLVWKITGDNTDINKALSAADKNAKGLGNTFGGLQSKITAALSVTALAVFGKKLVGIASDAEESNSKFNAVFKEQADSVNAWAEKYNKSFGLSITETKKLAASLQDTFVPLGFARDKAAELSTSLVELAGDVGSFDNVARADVLRDFQSALVGNTETVRKYGIIITEARLAQEAIDRGISKTGKNLSEQDKVWLRYQIILSGTTDAQGDLARTSDSFSNQLVRTKSAGEALAESLGNQLLPAATGLVSALGDTLLFFTEMDEGARNTIIGLTLLAVGIGPAIAAVNSLKAAIISLNTSALFGPTGIIVGFAAITAALILFDQKRRIAQRGQEELFRIDSADTYEENLDKIAKAQEIVNAKEKEYLDIKGSAGAAVAEQSRVELADMQRKLDILKDQVDWQRQTIEQDVINERITREIAAAEAAKAAAEEEAALKKAELLLEASDILQENLSEYDKLIEKIRQLTALQGLSGEEERIRNKALNILRQKANDIENEKLDIIDHGARKAQRLAEKMKEQEAERLKAIAAQRAAIGEYFGYAASLLGAFGGLSAALASQELAQLDQQLQAELEAAGVATDTATEAAQKKLDEAIETGDAEQINEAENALKKAEIEEKYAKKKAQLEYRAAMFQWELQKAISVATGAQAILSAAASIPFNPVLIGIASALAALQTAAVFAAKPVAKYAEGGIVPGSSFSGDKVPIAVNSGEMILNREQQSQLFSMLNSGGGKPISITVPLIVDGRQMAVANARYYNNGQVELNL